MSQTSNTQAGLLGCDLKLRLSFLIITKNEADNIPRCLESLPQGVPVVVVDSGSEDETVELCDRAGATVAVRAFDDYSSQKNFGLSLVETPFVFCIDADEVLSERLVAKLPKLLEPQTAYSVERRLIFLGKMMRFGKTRDHPIRLFETAQGKFQGTVHERVLLPSQTKISSLSEQMYHYSYRSLADYFERFNRYTTMIANQHNQNGKKAPPTWIRKIRPFLEFVYRYFFRLGFIDGHPGFVYALISSLYVAIKYEKLAELGDQR